MKKEGTFKYWQSMLRYPCGSLDLWNYPVSMRTVPITDEAGLVRQDAGPIDLAAIDIFRDRERGVPRFNDFRRRCATTASGHVHPPGVVFASPKELLTLAPAFFAVRSGVGAFSGEGSQSLAAIV